VAHLALDFVAHTTGSYRRVSQGGLDLKAHRLLYHSTLGLRVIKQKKKKKKKKNKKKKKKEPEGVLRVSERVSERVC